jgi:hypothetical protein
MNGGKWFTKRREKIWHVFSWLNEIPAATQLAKSVGRMKTEKKGGNCWRNVSNEKPHADYSAGYFEKKK